MGIQINFEPSAASVGNAGYVSGLGDFQRWLAQQQLAQNSQALQAAGLAQQGQFHQDQLAANLYGQNLDYLSGLNHLAASNQENQQNRQFQWDVHGAQQAQQQQRDQYLRNWENDA